MEHIEQEFANLDNLRRRKTRCPGTVVVVPSNDEGRGDATEIVDHAVIPDVPGMDDEIGPPEDTDSLGSNQPVCIRDDAQKDFTHGTAISEAGQPIKADLRRPTGTGARERPRAR